MKLLKWFLILFAVGLLIVVAGVLYVLNSPGLQKSIVQGALEKKVAVPEFEYFKAGLSEVQIKSLAIEKDGMVVGLDSLTLKYSFWDYVFGKEVRVENLDVEGVVINLRGPSVPMGPGPVIPQKSSPSEVSPGTVAQKQKEAQAKEKEAQAKEKEDEHETPEMEPFEGIFAHGVLPFKLYVGEVNVKAQVLLPDQREVNATISGGGIEPGASGEMTFTVTFDDEMPQAQLQRAQVDGKLTLTQNEEAAITRILLKVDVEGDSSAVENAPKLTLTADLAQQADKTETYLVTMAEADQPDAKLVNLDATFDPGKDHLKGTLVLTATDAQVAAVAPQDKLPAFDLDGDVDFDVITTSGEGTVVAKLKLVLDQLTRVREELSGLGQVTLTANLETDSADEVITLKRADAGLASANQGQLLVLEMLKQFSFKCGEDADMPALTGDLVRLSLNALPLSLVDPWLPGIKLSGQPVSAQVLVSGESGGVYRITLPKGLNLSDLSVVKDGEPMLDALSIAAQPTIVYRSDEVTVDLPGLKLSQRGVPLAQGQAHIVADPSGKEPEATVKAELSGDLAQVLKQPALARFNNVAAGSFQASADVDYEDGEGEFTLKAALSNLLVRQPMKQVSQMTLEATGTLSKPNTLEVSAPLVIKTSEGNSDLSLKAKLTKPADVQQFDVTVTGDQLDLDGVQLLAAAFKNPSATPPAPAQTGAPSTRPAPAGSPSRPAPTTGPRPAPAGPQADTVPFWNGFAGQASAKIGKIYMKQYRLDDSTFKLVLTQDKLTVDPLAATFAGAPLKADTVITFTPGASPYDMKSTLKFSQFDVGKFLVQEKPGTAPPLSGMFDVSGTATGTGPTMDALMQKIQGKFNLEGKNGSLRVLAAAGQEGLGNLAGVGLGLASMFQKNQRTGVQTAQRLIQTLQEIQYDRFAIVADRGQNLDINLSELAMSGPEIRMNGTGKVTYAAGTPLPEQALSGQVQLSAKGDAARLFSDLRMLSSSTPDADGFYPALSFPLKGTLSKPDFSELLQKLMSAAVATYEQSDEGRMQKTDGQGTGESTDGQSDSQQGNNSTNNAQDAVRGLLNNLLNGN